MTRKFELRNRPVVGAAGRVAPAALLERPGATRRSIWRMALLASGPQLAAAVLAGSVALSPMLASAATFGEVMQWCSAPRSKGDETLCSGYMTAVLKLLETPDPVLNGGHQICLPAGDVGRAVLQDMVAWRRQHPEADTDDAVATVGEALSAQYSCK